MFTNKSSGRSKTFARRWKRGKVFCVRVCIYVCVCDREREREERENASKIYLGKNKLVNYVNFTHTQSLQVFLWLSSTKREKFSFLTKKKLWSKIQLSSWKKPSLLNTKVILRHFSQNILKMMKKNLQIISNCFFFKHNLMKFALFY